MQNEKTSKSKKLSKWKNKHTALRLLTKSKVKEAFQGHKIGVVQVLIIGTV